MKINETNLIDSVEELKRKGFGQSYAIKNNELISLDSGKTIPRNEFEINIACRFDIEENANDSQYLFGIKSEHGDGVLIDILGNHLFHEGGVIEKKLTIPIEVHIHKDTSDEKYGLKKVYKEDFELNPNRFELRINYPDFPQCPFNQTFSILGFDKDLQQYVWLVTSILKDSRLQKFEFGKSRQ